MLKHARSSARWSDKNIGQKGFTLIELLVVIIVLGILAGIVVLSVNSLRDSSDQQACETEAKTVESAAAAYYADYDLWPGSSADLADYMDDPLPSPAMAIDSEGQVNLAVACP